MCDPRQTSFTRSKWDDVHQADDARITSYAGRYAFTPYRNCPSSFPKDVTTRIQESGASWPKGYWKTEVESDLMGIGRPSSRWRETSLQYNPTTNPITNTSLEHAPDESSPNIPNRLSNPPCTLRATGWNRWDILFHNPQDTFETPFDHLIPSKTIDKYKYRTHVPATNTFTEGIAQNLRKEPELR
jgi:hypothetical protein